MHARRLHHATTFDAMRVDKIEARLKALLKQGSNKRCINCDSLVSAAVAWIVGTQPVMP